ncbi:MAG: NF038122 family metalloprotease, partial [Nitrospirota bacterium]
MATWKPVSGAKGYLLDVSTSSAFDSYVDGYHDLDVGDATGRTVTGLKRGTTYYYRVRAYGVRSMAGYTETIAVTTEATTGLTIQPTFDSSITGDPNAARIEATINRAISIYESLFTDPITIQIRFRYATALPDGTPLSGFSLSLTVVYPVGWNIWINALRADATSSNDSVAVASLPANALSVGFIGTSANGRALGLNTPPAMFADGTVGAGGPYDGIVTLNSASLFQFTRPTDANRIDAQRSIEQEIDNVMGFLYNAGNFTPDDLFSWLSPGNRNKDLAARRYFSIDGGVTNIIDFNNNQNGPVSGWLSATCPQTHPYVQNAFLCTGQYSDISATSPEGINLDVIGYNLAQTGPAPPPSLGNISTRSFVQTGDNVMIGGFIVQGTGPKRVIIRAIGPELTQYGITNALANPTLELHNGAGAVIATNDDWQTTVIGGIIT